MFRLVRHRSVALKPRFNIWVPTRSSEGYVYDYERVILISVVGTKPHRAEAEEERVRSGQESQGSFGQPGKIRKYYKAVHDVL